MAAVTAILVICWLPYLLSYIPGGVYADTYPFIFQGMGQLPWNNHNPVLYAVCFKIVIGLGSLLGQGLFFSLEIFTLLQTLAMAGTFAFLLYCMYKQGLSKIFIGIIGAFFAFFPLFPFYAVSLWKDTPFNLAILLYVICILDIVSTGTHCLQKPLVIIQHCVVVLLVVFLRNNGIYIIILTSLILLFVYRKLIRRQLMAFAISIMACLIAAYCVQGPVFDKLGWNEAKAVESYGCLLQHICYVVSKDGDISEEQLAFIDRIIPVETIREAYTPCIVDKIKWNPQFDLDFFNAHKKEFLTTWASIAVKNPVSVIAAHLFNTLGFWDICQKSDAFYIQPTHWTNVDVKIAQKGYFKQIFGFSFGDLVHPNNTHIFSSATFAWILLCCMALLVSKKKYTWLLVCLPCLFLWMTVMLAAPLAFSLRYVYALVLFVPIACTLPLLPYKPVHMETNPQPAGQSDQKEKNPSSETETLVSR